MATKTNLLAFMTDAPDGKYQVTKPTDEQLTAVLPWLLDSVVKHARAVGYCSETNDVLKSILGKLSGGVTVPAWVAADGFDCRGFSRDGYDANGRDRHGYDRDGYNANGRDRNGFNRDGYDRYGYNRDGFNGDGLNKEGLNHAQAAAKLVGGWSKEHLEMVTAKLAEREAAKAAAEPVAEPATEPAAEPAAEQPATEQLVIEQLVDASV